MKQKNIILCGFMGCGKSTVGALLAKKTGMSFIDLDSYIEKKENKTVSKIFADSGEDYFRALEIEAARELSERNGLVIAAGGGTLVFRENVEVLKKSGRIVLLELPVETVAKRLENDTTRPLLNRPDKDEAMRELYNKRLPLYRAVCDLELDTTDLSPEETAETILEAFSK